MNHTKKMKLIPMDGYGDVFGEDMQVDPEPVVQEKVVKKENNIRKYAADRQKKLLYVVLKLASYGGYDEDGRIRTRDGSFLDSSDIIPLLLHALSPGRNYHGLDEFIDLLHRAGVAPEYIINSNVRDLLRKRQKEPSKRKEIRFIPRSSQNQSSTHPQTHHVQHPVVDLSVDPKIHLYTTNNDSDTIMKEKKRMREAIDEYEESAKRAKWDPQDSSDDDL